ncbi:MAG TPA: pseudaminic acid cytidylyltransferase [Rhodospirillaceae bacterium]|nr:pseudaminic acid cytidylyltransferase [Magnetovibrio sp.]HBT44430.1 pseudaminic acid cytidylyltransferase [Rhodospirillaceae bacterium]HCS70924.1 pseudaminic acid cytidylyltransferase [Rhodospirillaceae bacterium]|tara:strand:+ start:203 stop:916 length:714 start_codon:yes stop_codon:yes gene_type:complete
MTSAGPKRIAVIPARGGSKRLPGKNIRDFCGGPMIGHILRAARESGLFDVIHVSTEDAEIREVCTDLGFAPDFERDSALADDVTPILPVLKFVIDTYAEQDKRFDQVWLLMACAPLITADDLRAAAAAFERAGGTTPLLPVAPFPVPVEWALDLAPDGHLSEAQPGMFAVRSQDLPQRYYDTGTFAVFPEAFVGTSEGAGSLNGFAGLELPRYKAVDIDNEEDWQLAERIFRGGMNA